LKDFEVFFEMSFDHQFELFSRFIDAFFKAAMCYTKEKIIKMNGLAITFFYKLLIFKWKAGSLMLFYLFFLISNTS
jgi:hypothetical protein